jgi:type VI secretion system protein ImpC
LTTAPRRPQARRRDAAAPLRLLLCADFSGRGARGLNDPAALATRALPRVDVDSLDAVMARLAPALTHAADGAPVEIGFTELDDFHPDRLYAQSGLFDDLQGLRERLSDPAQFARAKAEFTGAAAKSEPESDAATLARLLGREAAPASSASASAPAAPPGVQAAVEALVRSAMAADAVSSPAPEQTQYLSGVDAAIAERMRGLLHAPAFQALEAAWRTVQLLVSRLELDGGIELYLFDATRAELAAAAAEPDLERSGLWQALVERRRDPDGDTAWSMVVALEAFDASNADVALLATLAATAAAGGAPLIAGASPRLLGCETRSASADPDRWQPLDADSQARWQALRQSPLAPWIGLVAPGLLLRLPYGKGTDPLERFDFDEMAGVDPQRGCSGASRAPPARCWLGSPSPLPAGPWISTPRSTSTTYRPGSTTTAASANSTPAPGPGSASVRRRRCSPAALCRCSADATTRPFGCCAGSPSPTQRRRSPAFRAGRKRSQTGRACSDRNARGRLPRTRTPSRTYSTASTPRPPRS